MTDWPDLLRDIHLWVVHHPHWAGAGVALVALLESLALVGMLVPGVALMFAAGALIGFGALPFWPLCVWAMAGAVVGDGLSFWLGRRFRRRIDRVWPFDRHPELLRRGVAFFRRYGGLSVLFGRFVGPVRAVIPLVAGMMGMPGGRFVLVNVVSAALWAPAYLLPGVVFGASLELAARVAGRLAVLLVALLALSWVGVWLGHRIYRFFRSRTQRILEWWFDLCRDHPLAEWLVGPLLYPWQRDYLTLTLLGLLLALGFLPLRHFLPAGPPLSLVFLHTPWSDAFFSAVRLLTDWSALLVLGGILGFWLLLTRRRVALLHWLISLGFCALFDALEIADGAILRGLVGYGFLALVIGAQTPPRWRWLVFSVTTVWWSIVIFARLYLAPIALTALLLSLAASMVWLVMAGVGYRRHQDGRIPGLGGLVLVLIAGALALLYLHQRESPVARPVVRALAPVCWWRHDWRRLSRWRQDLFGERNQALVLQWTGRLGEIRAGLAARGWRPAPRPGITNVLFWLAPESRLEQLPVLPHLHAGRPESLVWLKLQDRETALIVRLWPSGYCLRSGVPVWLGTVGRLHLTSALWGWVRFGEEAEKVDRQALALLLADLRRSGWCMEERASEPPLWLIRPCRIRPVSWLRRTRRWSWSGAADRAGTRWRRLLPWVAGSCAESRSSAVRPEAPGIPPGGCPSG